MRMRFPHNAISPREQRQKSRKEFLFLAISVFAWFDSVLNISKNISITARKMQHKWMIVDYHLSLHNSQCQRVKYTKTKAIKAVLNSKMLQRHVYFVSDSSVAVMMNCRMSEATFSLSSTLMEQCILRSSFRVVTRPILRRTFK